MAQRSSKLFYYFVLITMLMVIGMLAAQVQAATKVLYDYQNAEAMKTISSDDSGPTFEKTTEHVAAGATGLKVTFPASGGKIVALPSQTDWSAYDYLVFDVFNPGDQPVLLQVEGADHIAASNHKPLGNYKDRFVQTFPLAPGNNTCKVPVSHAWTCEVLARRVDTKKIVGFMFWLPKSKQNVTLTFGPISLATADEYPDTEVKLFDFEDPASLASWSNLDLPDATPKSPPAYGDKLHPLKFELSTEHATSGKHSLKITATGGDFPTIITTKIPVHNFAPYKAFHADITAPRTCVVIFRAMGEKSARDSGWDAETGRWAKGCLLHEGVNHVAGLLGGPTKNVSFEITFYHPHEGESIYVDNIRLSRLWPEETTPYRHNTPGNGGGQAGEATPGFPALDKKWKALGMDGEFDNPTEFARQFVGKFTTPTKPLSMGDVEAQFKEKYEALKATHPNAVMAIFRQGDKGFDPKNPDKVYEGWKDAALEGHSPPGVYIASLKNKPGDHFEVFMRRRGMLISVDLSSIPTGSNILAAELVVTRTTKGKFGKSGPGLLVAEACNRPFDPAYMNCFEYAKDKFWNAVDGMEWRGNDPDFLSLIVAYGPSHLWVIPCDFTNAVRYWTDGQHKNYGFAYYDVVSVLYDYFLAYNSHAKQLQDRPAMFVVFEPK